ncbi:MAG: GntR family transcriptional regulator [Planctomycetales bacterium]
MPTVEQLKLVNSGITLAEAVYETLLESIVSGDLASGTVLSEVAVAKDLAVSRTPVHDALRQLAKDGLVDQAAGRRARVADFSRDDVFEIFEMRKFLEGPAAELAASRMDRRQLIPLRMAANDLAQNRETEDWLSKWINHDEEFHSVLAKASGNSRLWKDIANYRQLHRGLNRISTNVEFLQAALAEHQAILDALESGDPQAARSTMIAHLDAWPDNFVRHFPR